MRSAPGRRILLNATPVPRLRDPRRHPIELNTTNATPLRYAAALGANCCYAAQVDARAKLYAGESPLRDESGFRIVAGSKLCGRRG
jgi:hypothetical protein